MSVDPNDRRVGSKDKKVLITVVIIAVIIGLIIYFLSQRNSNDMRSMSEIQDNSPNIAYTLDG